TLSFCFSFCLVIMFLWFVTGNTPGKKDLNFCILYTPRGNRIDVLVPEESIRAISKRSSYARATIELRANEELKDTIMLAMAKITDEGYYTCSEECPKNLGVGVAKNLKKHSQTSRCVSVGPKVGFKPHKEYRPVPKKATANSSGNKKKGEPIIRSSFWNVKNSITDKIGKYENIIIDGQAILMNEAGNPLKRIEYSGDHDSEDDVVSVDNDMARSMASEMVGFETRFVGTIDGFL
nr:hypothetical protein [Tanacetum cinerariifolium]